MITVITVTADRQTGVSSVKDKNFKCGIDETFKRSYFPSPSLNYECLGDITNTLQHFELSIQIIKLNEHLYQNVNVSIN